jgi:ATP-dependent Clp protease adapter protein ClpS
VGPTGACGPVGSGDGAEEGRPDQGTLTAARMEDVVQVVLHNDDHNTMEHVVESLMRVFGHGRQLAIRIMIEAHREGRAVAEVEALSPAIRHRDQLRSCSLSATVERIC